MRGFLADVYLRPSCYACSAKSGKSGSDITIADAWGMDCFAQEHDDDKGACYVLESTSKGVSYMNLFSFEQHDIGIDVIKRYNPSYASSVKPHAKRTKFFRFFANSKFTLTEILNRVFHVTYWDKIKWSLRRRINMITNKR